MQTGQPNRASWRAHHCSLLSSSEWSGKSLRPDASSVSGSVETVWSNTKLLWDAQSGQIKGEGLSWWSPSGNPAEATSVPFEIVGAFNPTLTTVEMLKTHRGSGGGGGAGGTVTHLAFTLDLTNQTLTGNFAGGGSCVLQRSQGGPPQLMQRGISNTSTSSSSGAIVGPAAPPSSSSASSSASGDHGLVAPKDLSTFLSLCFPDNLSVASRIHQSLLDNEIHDPESLTTFGPEEWKELGIVLGHRSRIKLQLQRFFPSLVNKGAEGGADLVGGGTGGGGGGVAGSVSPSNALSQNSDSSLGAANPPYLSHPGQQQQFAGSANGSASAYGAAGAGQQSHFMPLGGQQGAGGYGSSAQGFNGSYAQQAPPPSQQQQQQQSSAPSIPLEFLCPITRELMDDPVTLLGDGHSYDRASILQWLDQKKTSPITGKILASKAVQTNFTLRQAIANWKGQFIK